MTARSLARYYQIDGDTLERAYKDHLSGYREWSEGEHADRYLLFPENIGPRMSIDETSTQDGELFTILSNRDAHCRKGSIAAIVRGTRVEDVVGALARIPEEIRFKVEEVTMDLASSMAIIVDIAFPLAVHVLDRFHIQRSALEAVNSLRLKYKREAMAVEAAARKQHRSKQVARSNRLKKKCVIYSDGHSPRIKSYVPERLSNGETLPDLLERSSHLLMKSPNRWTERQRQRADLLFSICPQLRTAFSLSCSLRSIFNNRNATRDSARASLSEWYEKVSRFKNQDFIVLSETLQSREDEVVNFFINRSTNAAAESLNSKIKSFRAQLRGVSDLKFFLFRLTRIYA